jgi:hypothetical protein
MSAGYLVTMKGGFLGYGPKIVFEYPDARKFETASKAELVAKQAAEMLKIGRGNYEVMSVEAYDTGGAK